MPKGINTKEKKVYFGTDEWETVCKKAAAAEMKVGTYIRYIAVHGIVKKYDVRILDNLVYAINSVGRNINQIAKTANFTGEIYKKELENGSNELVKISKRIDVYFENLTSEEVK